MFSAALYAIRHGRRRDDAANHPRAVGGQTTTADDTQALVRVSTANEIFFMLDSRHTFYDVIERLLYFVNAPGESAFATIEASLAGLGSTAVFEQIYLDPHNCFNGARRIRLTPAHATVVLVALRLAGTRTTLGWLADGDNAAAAPPPR